ncbi:hypothetical protein DFR86_09560 [Acidianus sulfidivorans JP7]|uniref:B box-type domain-containing protein n=1 Tax=Acidianus sulfidivorans JP7 TaxID=619593 RepID=A0A2U9IQI4_9CREN|nr:hypothetical protein DFR86_09560 [Acidianus sulfidivorans JP7]
MMRRINGLKNLCEICETKEAKYTCKICKRHVCEDDFNKEKQICSVCEMTLCQICGKNLSLGYCEKCGKLICDQCTGYFDGAKRICKECLRIERIP